MAALDVGVGFDLVHVLGLAALHHLLGGALRLPHGPALGDGLLGDFALQFDGGQREKAAGVAGGEAALGDELLQIRRQLEQAHEIDDGGAVFAGALADLLGAESAVRGPGGRKRYGGFDRVEILALDVLDQRDFEQAVIGDVRERRPERRPSPASLAARQRRSPATN